VWEFPIAFYLFLGGLAAGILIYASIAVLMNKEKELPATTMWAPVVAPIAIVIGLLALIVDLTHKLYVWQLYMTIRIESPMSWGAWVLMLVTPLAFLWVFADIRTLIPRLDWKFSILYKLESFIREHRKFLAIILIPLCLILGIYTGILLSAFNARPLWNNAILGPLFLVSGLSTAAAVIILMAKSDYEKHLFSKIDVFLIIVEIGLIIHMVMGYYAGGEAQVDAIQILINGDFSTMFFVFLIGLGLLFPLALEVLELMGLKMSVILPAILVLIGGLVFRILMVDAGQLTRILY
jgi:formate-dependent nitrite reductase membrane component NrfD